MGVAILGWFGATVGQPRADCGIADGLTGRDSVFGARGSSKVSRSAGSSAGQVMVARRR